MVIHGVEVSLEPRRLADYRNMRKLYKLRETGSLSYLDEWGEGVFGSDWERMVDEFADAHDGYCDAAAFVSFVNEIIETAKEDETAKN